MKGDFSRRTFDATKHYSAVLVEQGRLLTDADSDEEHRILAHRHGRTTSDLVGGCGGPLPDAGFGLSTTDNTDLLIGAGRFYADGTLLENESEVDYREQPDRFDVVWPLPAAGRFAILLHSWPRLVTALDDPSIREVALGGPTTSARERVVWQVEAAAVQAGWVCTDEPPALEQTTGQLAARAEPAAELSTPCLVPPQAGYTGLENQLYRVEIFDSGDAYDLDAAPDSVGVTGFVAGEPNRLTVDAIGPLAVGTGVEVFRSGPGTDPVEATFGYVTGIDGLTLTLTSTLPSFGPNDAPRVRLVDTAFVVSRDNGCVVTSIEAIDGTEVRVHDLGPDDVLGFAIGQLVEISDDRIELEGHGRRLYQIADLDKFRNTVILRTAAEPLSADPDGIDPLHHPKLRRWDAAGAVRFLADGSAWIHLENGNQVRFVDGHYRSGDHWIFPARAATIDTGSGTIEWPHDGGAPALRPPRGIRRHRCVLGYVDVDGAGTITKLEDCRDLFPPLTSMRNLLYVGGDGQEGSPSQAAGGFIPLPGSLDVRVANGGFPVAGAVVRYSVALGNGRLDGGAGPVDATTDADGFATCTWGIDTAAEHQLCVAQLLAPSGDPIPHQLVRFHATVDTDGGGHTGCCLTVGEGGDYPTLEEALKDQIERGSHDICLCLMPGDHKFEGEAVVLEPEKQPTNLAIHGCGRGSRLHVSGRWILEGWPSVRLSDLDIFFADDASLTLVDVTDVEVRNCHVFGMRPDGALTGVHGFHRLQVTGCVLVVRRRGVFDLLRELFTGIDPLARLWEDENEVRLRDVIVEVAMEVVGMSNAARKKLNKQLVTAVDQQPDAVSRGELDAVQGLANLTLSDTRFSDVARVFDNIARAATVARPGVPLEIGAGRRDEQIDIAGRVSVVIADNLIPGVVTFYGRGEPHLVVDEDVLKRLDGLVRDAAPIVGTEGDVHVRDNRIGRVGLGIEMIKRLDGLVQDPGAFRSAFESFHLTDNVIDGLPSEIVSRHSAANSNDFTLDSLPIGQEPPNGIVANVIGDTATYTGNHGRDPSTIVRDITRTSAEAANLEIQVL